MKVSEVKYARKFNTGNYESEEYAVTAIVEDDDNAADVFGQLKKEVTAAHSGEGKPSEEEAPNEDQPARRRGSKKGKGSDSDEGEANEETEKVEGEEDESEEQEAGNDETEDDSQEEESEEKPLGKSSRSTDGQEAGKAKAGKKFKKKPQVYQRTNPSHKDIFSTVLKEVFPTWKKDEKTKAKGKVISQKMEGEEFLDENGKVLASFKQSAKKLVTKK